MNELTINLLQKSETPLYQQIYDYIKQDIQNGRFAFQEKLPSTRALSRHLEVSRSTVELAYEQLLSEGYIEAVPCKGFFVAGIEELYRFQKMEVKTRKREKTKVPFCYDFTPRGVDLKSFPYQVWRKLTRQVLLHDQAELFRAGDSQGEYEFREVICRYLHQARGVNCTPEQLVVGAGSEFLLMLLSMLVGKKQRIAVENPTYLQVYKLFQSLSYDVRTVEMDRYGMKMEALKEQQADLAYVMPSHQYPMGTVMPIRRRMELLNWANERKNRYIIEDDYDSEFRYKGKPIPALQGYDAHGRVIYVGTFSKSIAPAIRMSYMVLPETLLQKFQKEIRFLNSTVSRVDQQIVKLFIEEGYYERHLNKTRALYKNRHDTLISSLKPLLDRCSISGEHAGVHLLLTFRNGMSEHTLLERAEKKRIRVYGLSEYLVEQKSGTDATVLLGYANMEETDIREAIGILNEIWIE